MTPFSALISTLTDEFRIALSDDWLQGRTAYGGLSAALCVEAALRAIPELPPLRAAQFAFIGPAAGELSLRTSILRRGKSSVFVGVDLIGEAGLATRAVLSFAVARKSAIAYDALAMPEAKRPEDCPPFFPGDKPIVNFQAHFESRLAGGARPRTPDAEPRYLIWFRHRDEKARSGLVPLIALADAPPPAAMVLFTEPAPISTMTWTVDMLSDELATRDGWWLIESRAQAAAQGYSQQTMTVWSADGKAAIAARQNVAIFT
ncbi:MAG: thioesterase family protein [Alphaproteobacteria bacterium]|nr:thioesterase family protein [Alphaproteobacteria bacterium]